MVTAADRRCRIIAADDEGGEVAEYGWGAKYEVPRLRSE